MTLDLHGISIEAELSDKRGEIVAYAEDSLNAIAHILKEANEINRRLGNDPIKYEIVMLEAKLSQLKDSVHKYIRPVTAKSILEKAANTINIDSSALKGHKVEPSTKPEKIKHEQSTTQPNTLQIGNSVRDPKKLIDNFSGTLKHIIIENNVISETLSVPKSILSITLISSVISQIESATPIGQLTIRQYRYSKTRMVTNCSNLVIENTLSEIDISGLVSMATTSIHIANSEVKNESDALNGSNLRTISLAHIENAQEIRLLDNGNRSLEKITIRSCPNLKTVFSPLTSLNNLETIDVIASPNFVLPSDITRAKNLIRAAQTMNNCDSFPTAPTVFIAVFDNYRSASLSAKEYALKGKSVKVKKYGRFTVLTGGTTALTLTESQVETLFMLRKQYMTLEEVPDVKCISSSTALNHAADMIASNYLKLDDICYNIRLKQYDQKLIYAHFLEQASKNQTLRTKEVMEQYEHQIEELTYTDLHLMKSEIIRVNDYLQRTNNI